MALTGFRSYHSHVVMNSMFSVPLGCADFVPSKCTLYYTKYESFNRTLSKARDWLEAQKGIRFVSVESVEYKLKKDDEGGKASAFTCKHNMATVYHISSARYKLGLVILFQTPRKL